MTSSRPGFALVAAIALIAILAISTAVAVPVVIGYLDAQRVQNARDDLRAVAHGDSTFNTLLGKIPGRISHLAEPIAATDSTTCNGIAPSASVTTYGATTANKWVNGAPFFYRSVPTSGLPTDIGVVDDIEHRETANNQPGAIDLVIPNAYYDDARALNDLVDGTAEAYNGDESNSLGIVQWSAPGANRMVRLVYRIALPAGC